MDLQIFELQTPETPSLVGLALLLAFERQLATGNWDGSVLDVREMSLHFACVAIGGGYLENDYDVQFLRIPYGPGWDARKTVELVRWTVSVIFLPCA